jgi:hypothetical protein
MNKTEFICGVAVVLPPVYFVGEPMDETVVEMLHRLHVGRVTARIHFMLAKGLIGNEEIYAKAQEIAAEGLRNYVPEADDDDPVQIEAMTMARSLIVSRMSAEGLPPPKGLDAHAKALIEGMPALLEQARKRVEARYRAAAQLISL